MSTAIVPAPTLRRQAPHVGALCLAALVASCAVGPRPTTEPQQQRIAAAETLDASGQHAAAAARFESLAEGSPELAGELLARAALAWVAAGDRVHAAAAIERARTLPGSLDDHALLAIARAGLAHLEGDPESALRALSFEESGLTDGIRARVLGARAEVEAALGMPMIAVVDLVKRATLLTDPAARRGDAQRIWEVLLGVKGSLDPATLPLNSTAETRDWVALAAIARGAWQDPEGARARADAWRRAHPDHPAVESVLPALLAQLAQPARYPEKVALLVPLSGRYASQAEALRDGFFAAHYASGAQPELQVFDTTDYPGGATSALEAARAWGAGFVVGPLTRESVAELAAKGAPDRPLLALNYLDGDGATADRFWQFGLLPEGEAAAVAEHAASLGLTRALLLFPKGDWGSRMQHAFQARFEALGGTVLMAQAYDPEVEGQDFSPSIMHMLGLDESALRANLLTNALGQKLETEPRRRRDAQFVFVAAHDREAPLLRAQLRFHRAADLPTFATSAVFRTDGAPEADLDGLEFADMPWTISSEPAVQEQRARLAALWPETIARAGRLYALGLDAYRLIPLFANLPAPLAEPVPGTTGLLSMGEGHRIKRDLYWARFADGVPAPVVAPAVLPETAAQ